MRKGVVQLEELTPDEHRLIDAVVNSAVELDELELQELCCDMVERLRKARARSVIADALRRKMREVSRVRPVGRV